MRIQDCLKTALGIFLLTLTDNSSVTLIVPLKEADTNPLREAIGDRCFLLSVFRSAPKSDVANGM